MRVLICGSRDWADQRAVEGIVTTLPADAVVIHGAAPGADTMAGTAARARGLAVEVYPANWQKHGRAAGPIRNQQMLDTGKPDRVIAFRRHGISKGTDDMIERAQRAGLPVSIYLPSESWDDPVPLTVRAVVS